MISQRAKHEVSNYLYPNLCLPWCLVLCLGLILIYFSPSPHPLSIPRIVNVLIQFRSIPLSALSTSANISKLSAEEDETQNLCASSPKGELQTIQTSHLEEEAFSLANAEPHYLVPFGFRAVNPLYSSTSMYSGAPDRQWSILEEMHGDTLYDAPLLSDAFVLEVGCSRGYWALKFARRHPGCVVVGVDAATPI